jgi:very-short-patch-repair endonuclease
MWPFGCIEYRFNVHELRDKVRCFRKDGRPREWAFDWALPEHKVAVELDGYTYHTSRAGWLKDMEKFNYATLQGWRVFHITPDDFRNGHADLLMEKILSELLGV